MPRRAVATMRWVAGLLVLAMLATTSSAQEDRGPIAIYDDADFLAPTSGVRSGTGTAADPFVISDYRIVDQMLRLPGASTAIHVENTDAFVTFRSIEVGGSFTAGVNLVNANNVSFEKINIGAVGRGFEVALVNNLLIDDLDVVGAGPDDFAAGIFLRDSTQVVLRNIVVVDGQGVGIHLANLESGRLEGARVSGHDGGIRVFGMKNVDMVGVQVDDSRGDGVWIANSTGLQVLGLTSSDAISLGPQSGRGLVVWDSYGLLQEIWALRNGDDGMQVLGGRLVISAGRMLDNQGRGLLAATPGLVIQGLEAHGNKLEGLVVGRPAVGTANVRLTDAQLHNNRIGLLLQGLDGVHVENVRAENNDAVGADIRQSGNVTVLASHFNRNGASGLLTVRVSAGQLVDSQAKGNDEHGFSLRETSGMLVRNNSLIANGGSGLIVDGKSMRITGNQILDNGAFGVEILPAAVDVEIIGNQIRGNLFGNTLEAHGEESPAPGIWLAFVLVFCAIARARQGALGNA